MDQPLPQCSLKQLEQKLNIDFAQGLTQKQVQKQYVKDGLNKLKEIKKPNFWVKFLYQLHNSFVYILLIIFLFTLIIGIIEQKKEELFESFLILIVILGNALLGVFFENRKENSLLLVEQKTKPYAKVLRDKKLQFILKEQIVLGDIITLEAGDVVPADLLLIEANYLKTNEVILTGEILPVLKNTPSKEDEAVFTNFSNLVFMDTTVISGKAYGVVIATGKYTRIGKIHHLIKTEKKYKTPLEKNIKQLSSFLTIIIFLIVLINLFLNLLKHYYFKKIIDFDTIKKLLLSSFVLAVAVIPESLLAIITIILAYGVKKIIKQKVIIKNLKTLETLGAVNIVCTDKTGTLTKNQMTIKKLYLNNSIKDVSSSDLISEPDIEKLICFGILCNSNYSSQKNKTIVNNKFLFDPIDQSFIDLGYLWKLNILEIQKENPKIKEFPFDSNYKLMLTIHQKDTKKYLIIKGAYEIILGLSSYINRYQKNILKKENNIQKTEDDLNKMSSEGYKVLGIAYTEINLNYLDFDNLNIDEILKLIKNKIIFLGAVGIEDPIRPEIFPTMKELQTAFITPIMITGDHLQTAIKVASSLKIFNPEIDLAITGEQLDLLSEDELAYKLNSIKIYARTNPEHKLKIIKTWQKKDKIVAMIGDGVNDAPSIKKADIGISMGRTGTDITKQTSDIILVEDNFATITNAIKEGRNIFNNIKKSVIFLLSCNIGEIIVILLNTCLGHLFFNQNFIILNTAQILWINLVTDSLAAISLGMEHPENNLMKEKPRFIKNALLNKQNIQKILIEGFIIGILTFLAAFIGYKYNDNNNQDGQTIAFIVLSLSQLVHVFNLRSFNKSIFLLKTNFYLIFSFIISVFLQIIVIIIPFGKQIFNLSPNLSYSNILIIFIFSVMPLFLMEIIKKIKSFL
ncbi:cation transport ATPase, P-type [Candidatus Phytoplasma luffae]|uniref:Cation transport ATPase, P-type n=1 Tax=Loofah witches'-broom phytoplasma TaxID=35773 RepID=A0A975ILS4_LOWBP|nr:cation-transporting P-type ATPase [Candidatus Phytoplasma luffae]QTX02618.1 cation transport ATPase, P-type [Candidatus Phytoplasma luffae]